jgi:hypothetical protein
MTVTLSPVIDEPSLSDDYEHLKCCWESQIESNPKMHGDWTEIGEMVYSSTSGAQLYADLYSQEAINAESDRLRQSLSRAKEIHAKLNDFKLNYAEFMEDSQVESLNRFTGLVLSLVKSSEAFQYFHKSDCNKKSLEKLRLMKIGMDFYSESLPINFSRQVYLVKHGLMSHDDYEYSTNLLKVFLLRKSKSADEIVSSEMGFGSISQMRILQKSIKDTAISLISQIGSISGKKESLDYFLSDFEGSFIVLENQSAEAKAIRRIQTATDEDDDWVTYVEPGEEIDVDDLKSKLKACGYIE